MAYIEAKQAGEERLRKFQDVVFSYFLPTERLDEYRMPCHVLVMVVGGEMTVEDHGKTIVVSSGECVFLRRDHELHIHKYAVADDPYRAISIRFERNFLKNYWTHHKHGMAFSIKGRPRHAALKLGFHPAMQALFTSLLSFYTSENTPSRDFIHRKQDEAVHTLLQLNNALTSILFDFYDPWKIDILDFMEHNYQEELSISEYALYTGRSLATFKRDFARETGSSPERWLVQRRLAEAYRLLHNKHEKPGDVYIKVGFKNRSHFVTAFKRQYGVPPTQVLPRTSAEKR